MRIEMLNVLLLCLSILTRETSSQDETIYGWAQRSGEYSKWIKQVDRSDEKFKPFVKSSAFQVTAFIPTNEAFQTFSEPSDGIIGSHLVYGSLDSDTLLKMKNKSSLAVNRPMLRFIEGFNGSSNQSTIFVLDARILESHQVGNSMVHIIDRVLNLPRSREFFAPDALEWIKNPNIYPSVSVQSGVDIFADLIERKNVTYRFSNCTECTFFVPENIDSETAAKIDANVLLGHIIPNQILYLRSMNNSTHYKTKADLSNLTVELYKEERSESDSMQSLIYFNTGGSISTHLGNTRVKITRANIPVNNGVIYIIEKPLLITDESVSDHLNEESGTNEIHEPVNVPAQGVKLHFIEHETINCQSDKINEAPSLVPNREPNFSVDVDRPNVAVSDGVVTTMVESETGCIYEFLPYIDKVLSVPNYTIKNVLQNDKAFRTTFAVAEKIGSTWLNELGNKNNCYIFFAPSEVAWKKLSDRIPTAYKVLVEGSYLKGSKNVLDRLLLFNGVASANFLGMYPAFDTMNTEIRTKINTTAGKIQLTLLYGLESSTIVRPDIFTKNGYIHEIDHVFVDDRDVPVPASADKFRIY